MSSLYLSPEWGALELSARAELLLVNEGLKKSCIIGAEQFLIRKVIEKTSLVCGRHYSDSVWRIGSPEVLVEESRRLRELPVDSDIRVSHMIYGDALGYPLCCTQSYVEARFPGGEKVENWTHPFFLELRHLIEKTGDYPSFFDYMIYAPCKIDCKATRVLLPKWKAALEANDPAAARALVLLNWSGKPPMYLLHKEEVDSEERRRIQEALRAPKTEE